MNTNPTANEAAAQREALATAIRALIARDRITRRAFATRAGLSRALVYLLISGTYEGAPRARTLGRLRSAGVALPPFALATLTA